MLIGIIPTGAFAATMVAYDTAKLDNANLAAHMDEPLYTAIYGTYNNTGTPQLDANQDGVITTAEAGAWGGTALTLNSRGLTGGIRGLEYFTNKVTQINLSSNQLSGSVPAELGNLTELTLLYLNINQLSGTLPASFFANLDKLAEVRFENNKLSGPIPDSIGEMDSVVAIDFHGNQLTSIPDSIRNLKNVYNLYLENNQITSIPDALYEMTALRNVRLSNNQLEGNLSNNLGNLSDLVYITVLNNRLSGSIPESITQLEKLTNLELTNNQFSGVMPALSTVPANVSVKVNLNINLITPSTMQSNWGNYTNWLTAGSEEHDLNRISNAAKYANVDPQDGAEIIANGGYIVLNHDVDDDGRADINLTYNWRTSPEYNIDVNGDGKADLNIILNGAIGKNPVDPIVFNQAKAVTTTSDGFLGWVRPDFDYVAGMTKADFIVSPDYPHYVVAKTEGALVPGTGAAPTIVELNKKVGNHIINVDVHASDDTTGVPDGIPDLNIDLNGDGIPEYNITYGDGQTPVFNVGNDGSENPVQSTDPTAPNYDSDGDGFPDTNIDFDGDGTADLWIDQDGDGKPDVNFDTDYDGVPDVNIVTDGNGNLVSPVGENDKPNVNIDTDGDNIPDLNIDTGDDFIADIQIDVDGDGTADINLDTDGDNEPDINVDIDGDWKPDIRIRITVSVKSGKGTATATDATGKVVNLGDAGKTYTAKAVPAAGYVFAGWTDTFTTLKLQAAAALKDPKAASTTFVMPQGEVELQARFIKDPSDSTTIDPGTEGDTTVTGKGEPGNTIEVVTPDGKTVTTVVKPDGTWSVKVPALKPGQKLKVTTITPEGIRGSTKTVTVTKATVAPDDLVTPKPLKTGDTTPFALTAAALLAAITTLVALRKKETGKEK
jgi:hypothetical protein